MKLRDYQCSARDSVWKYFADGNTGNPIVAMPTGTGKSVVIGDLVRAIVQTWPGQRILMLTHVKELVRQNHDKLLQLWPGAPVGIVSSGLGKREIGFPITYAGVGSIVRHTERLGKIDLIFVDECHTVSDKDSSLYQRVIQALREVNPKLKVIGFSATPYRMGLGLLTEGTIFDDICFDGCTLDAFNWFIEQGYLVPLIPMPTKTKLDTDKVKLSGGEFQLKDLQRAVDKDDVTRAAIDEAIEATSDRNRVLVFSTGIEHCENIYNYLESVGERAAYVHSKMGDAFGGRDKVLADYRAGVYRWLVNADVLTTGFDDPYIDCIVMLRPTRSPGLWVQMLGRGTRPVYVQGWNLETREGRLGAIAASLKQNCLVLDFARNTSAMGPVNDPRLPQPKGKGGGDPPFKFCKNENTKEQEGCGAYNHPAAVNCIRCKAEFVFEVKITEEASREPLLAYSVPVYEEHDVVRMTTEVHSKQGKPDSIRATYYCGMRRFVYFVTPEHGGSATHRARMWWHKHSDGQLMPVSTSACLALVKGLRTPTRLKVWENKKHPEITEFYFD